MYIIHISNVDGSNPFHLCVLENNKDPDHVKNAIRTTLRQEQYNDDSNYHIEVVEGRYDGYIVVVNTDEYIQPVAVLAANVSEIRTFVP
jgi:hypothetical protein